MLSEPFDDPTIRRLLRLLLSSGDVGFWNHALEEMDKDDIRRIDVLRALQAGRWDGCDHERGSWRYRRGVPGLVVVVRFPCDTVVEVVTAWRE